MFGGRLGERLKGSKFFKGFFDPEAFAQFKRYVITGLVSFSIEYLLFALLFNVVRLKDLYAHTIALSIVFWINFTMNRLWSFKSKSSLKRQLLLYFILYMINMAATNAIMYLLSHVLAINPNISKVLVMGAVVSWNFVLYKKIIYRD